MHLHGHTVLSHILKSLLFCNFSVSVSFLFALPSYFHSAPILFSRTNFHAAVLPIFAFPHFHVRARLRARSNPQMCTRTLRDRTLIGRIVTIRADHYSVYEVRKMWHVLIRDKMSIGRGQTARLMRLAGVSGKTTGTSPITTRRRRQKDMRPDLVERDFRASTPKDKRLGRKTRTLHHLAHTLNFLAARAVRHYR